MTIIVQNWLHFQSPRPETTSKKSETNQNVMHDQQRLVVRTVQNSGQLERYMWKWRTCKLTILIRLAKTSTVFRSSSQRKPYKIIGPKPRTKAYSKLLSPAHSAISCMLMHYAIYMYFLSEVSTWKKTKIFFANSPHHTTMDMRKNRPRNVSTHARVKFGQ